MQTKEQLQLVVHDLFKQLKVIIRYTQKYDSLHYNIWKKGLTPSEVVAVVEAATSAAVKDTGVEARLILCTLRHFSEEQSLETVNW